MKNKKLIILSIIVLIWIIAWYFILKFLYSNYREVVIYERKESVIGKPEVTPPKSIKTEVKGKTIETFDNWMRMEYWSWVKIENIEWTQFEK